MVIADKKTGFTLVELAIVITIIGLLIGGVLKGQEMIQNARMTATANKIKSFAAAAMTFKDVYKALPGDITNPSSYIQNCTSSPCSIAGDGNGIVGLVGSTGSAESAAFFLHMAKAGLISGIDTSVSWDATTRYGASLPVIDLVGSGAMFWPFYADVDSNAGMTFTDGAHGLFYFDIISASGGTSYQVPTLPVNLLGKYDLKADDGRPLSGDVKVWNTNCGIADGATAYNPNDTSACFGIFRAGI